MDRLGGVLGSIAKNGRQASRERPRARWVPPHPPYRLPRQWPSHRKAALCRALLAAEPPEPPPPENNDRIRRLTGQLIDVCPDRGGAMRERGPAEVPSGWCWCTPIICRVVGCSFISLVQSVPMPHKHNTDRRHHIPKMRFKVQNWPAYEAGLRRRGSLTLWIEDAALECHVDEPDGLSA
jgi:hypothetical protein